MKIKMKSFKTFIAEKTKGSLHVFDVDETLFKTHAKIHVKKGDKTVKTLSNAEYNDHKLPTGHHYDYHEFRDAEKFHKDSEPMPKMLNKMKAIHKNIQKSPHHKVIINTARADMDDKDKYLDKFKKHGVPIHDIHVHRAGNLPGDDSVAEKKTKVVHDQLTKKPYAKVHMYDDSKTNLKHFLGLKDKHPNTEFHAHHVQDDGTTKKFKG